MLPAGQFSGGGGIASAAATDATPTEATTSSANNAFIDLNMKRVGDYGPGQLRLPAHAKTIVRTKINPEGETRLSYRVDNLHIDPDTGLRIDWKIAESMTIR